jgi:hypothetical protein
MKATIFAADPIFALWSAHINGYNILQNFRRVLNPTGNRQHLIGIQGYRPSRKLKSPGAFQKQDHLFMIVPMGMRNRSLLSLQSGKRQAIARGDLATILAAQIVGPHFVQVI